MIKYCFYTICFFLLLSCNEYVEENEGEAVAMAFDKKLFLEDLEKIVPENINSSDSSAITKSYIRSWVEQQVLLHFAKINLNTDEQNVDELVEKYKNSLLIFKYESKYLRERLDTIVSENELEAYYKENLDNYALNESVFRIRYLDADSTDRQNYLYWKWIKSDLKDDLNELDISVEDNQYEYIKSSNVWYKQEDLEKYFTNEEEALANILAKLSEGVYTKYSNGRKLYLYVEEILKVGETMPLQFAKDEIRLQIVNKRRTDLLKELRAESVNNALNKKNAEIINTSKP